VLAMPCTDVKIFADPKKTRQAVLNVLANAYKYSPNGGEVRIDVLTPQAQAGSCALVGICISDQGIGMTEDQASHVFERFYRADTSGKILGTGLGMSIVHEIVTLQGGRVDVQSTVGVGTTVTLWMPTRTNVESGTL
jgi:signal transduction histidine kinase